MAVRPVLVLLTTLFFAGPVFATGGTDKVQFSRDIQPILADNCYHCHGPDAKNRKAKLRLDDEAAAKANVVVPGKSGDSELYRRIASTDPDERMPPPHANRKLTAAQVQLVKRWIDEGAVWGVHWSLTRVVRPAVPKLARYGHLVKNPIDSFILARLEQEDLPPSAPASRATLIRRLSLDLTGLPPTPEEVGAFLADTAPDAYEKLVERLLHNPAYGERMAWDWLDAARYADSNGFQGDGDRTMWPWRDWVADAFNRNVPFDRFTLWQLAGDLLPGATLEQKLATGFCRNHMINGEGGRIPEENRVDYVMDMSETMGTVWLGLTLNCCRCHDHKFDPITQAEYYRLFAYFNQTPVDGGGGNPQTPPVLEMSTPAQKAQLAKLQAAVEKAGEELAAVEKAFFADGKVKIDALSKDVQGILKAAPAKRSRNQVGQLEKALQKTNPEYVKALAPLRTALDQRDTAQRALPRVMVMEDIKTPRKTFILTKGLYNKPGTEVGMGVPAKLPPLAADAPPNRLALARWLVAPEQPLTARVTVNRFWQQIFGRGLVKTPEDFGVQGDKPSHPELLDWLAAEFVESGWDVRHLLRLIVTSATYRQTSKATPQLLERDPQNVLLARGARWRLPSWMIRDQALAVSGLLARRVGGPPVRPYQPPGIWEEATFGNIRYQQGKGEDLYRRSLYTFWRRIVGPTMFFDNPSRQVCTVKQTRTNTPLHALVTLNDVTFVEAARVLAQRVLSSAAGTQEERIDLAFRLVLARSPGAAERTILGKSLARLRQTYTQDAEAAKRLVSVGESPRDTDLNLVEHAAYSGLCLALFNLDEALSKE
jgi:hypothetical protein